MLYQLLLLGIIGRLVKSEYCTGSDTDILTTACDCSGGGTDDCTVRSFLAKFYYWISCFSRSPGYTKQTNNLF